MRKFLVCMLVCLVLNCSFVSLAGSVSRDSLISMSRLYECNILGLLVGSSWEYPSTSNEFTPDEPLGEYIEGEPSADLVSKYETFLSLSEQSRVLDSGVSVEDAEEYKLTKEEELSLSDVEFEYYFNYDSDYVIQWFSVSWVDGGYSRGYVVWDSDGNVYDVVVL